MAKPLTSGEQKDAPDAPAPGDAQLTDASVPAAPAEMPAANRPQGVDSLAPAGARPAHASSVEKPLADRLQFASEQLLDLPTTRDADDDEEAGGRRFDAGDGGEDAPPRRPVSTGSGPVILLGGPVRVTADPATNALLVSATRRDWATIERVTTAFL